MCVRRKRASRYTVAPLGPPHSPDQLALAVETRSTLEVNISRLYFTAKLEIKRKNDEIIRLRRLCVPIHLIHSVGPCVRAAVGAVWVWYSALTV